SASSLFWISNPLLLISLLITQSSTIPFLALFALNDSKVTGVGTEDRKDTCVEEGQSPEVTSYLTRMVPAPLIVIAPVPALIVAGPLSTVNVPPAGATLIL